MVGITALKAVAREPLVHFLLQAVQQLVNLQDGVVPTVPGMGCGHLLVPDQQQGAVLVQLQAGVEHFSQLGPGELGQGGAVDFCPIQQALVGGVPQREIPFPHLDGQAQVLRRISDSLLADSGIKAGGVLIERGRLIQRGYTQSVDLGAFPEAGLAGLLVIGQHGGELGKLGGIAVLALFQHF